MIMDNSTEIMIALRTLRDAAKVVEKKLLKGSEVTTDEMSNFVNAIIVANSVDGIDCLG